ncbi:MAG TPA: hypothetical protein VFG81_06415 [Anaerolineales bacterium]|nr:hypothetical protein [Anaerolineales bacterium]
MNESDKEQLKGVKGFQEQATVGVSPWILSLLDELGSERKSPRWTYSFKDFSFEIVEGTQSLWIVARFPAGGEVAFRAAYCPDGKLEIDEIEQTDTGIELQISSTVGGFRTTLAFPRPDRPMLHYKTSITPVAPLVIPFWPRDVIPLGKQEDMTDSEGVIYTKQVGPRSGLVYFSLTRPRGGAVFYFQNLTSLNDYCKQTETSLSDVVGGEWPELGLALPATTEKTIEADRETVISDAYVVFSPKAPRDDLEMAEQFLDSLAQVFLALPRNETEYVHWPEIAEKSLRDLENEKCVSEVRGRRYLNAYVADYDNPPESMVQLTALLPLLEYEEWAEENIPFTQELLGGLPKFFDNDAKVLGRWLMSEKEKLDSSEPQKNPEAMDSWYLYHSLLNVSRLAIHGDKTAEKMFLDSMEYAIKVAHHFDYHWPVFYNMYTLAVQIPETKEGEGGEADVAGVYAHVMLQAYQLTKEERYLEEAKKAARTLKGLGFNLFYQANITLFGAGALLRLWKETGDEYFLQQSYVNLANAFTQMWLWECNYGYAEHYRTFFALFPLKDAPYTAVYEELEGFAAFHDYFLHYSGEMPEWLRVLVPEFLRNMLYKASFYYPPNLPGEVMTEEPKTGEIDPELWIPLEDIYDGWELAGQVGQEVYGAGLPFGIIPRHYWPVPDKNFMIYVDYPITEFSTVHEGKAMFRVLGDPRLYCRLRIMPSGRGKLPEVEVITERNDSTETLRGRETAEGHREYDLFGDRTVIVQWQSSQNKNGKKTKNGRKGSKK